jgi:uncharacterized protein
MATIVITGGTGLVGTALTKFLSNASHHVIVLTRNKNATSTQPNVSYAHWDVNSGVIDSNAITRADYIIHLAGAGVMDKKWTAAYKQEIINSRTQSAKLILQSLQQYSNNVKAVISASAIGWYGADAVPAQPFTEDMPADKNFLGATCQLWEQSVDEIAALGKRVVKLRIGIVLSNKGGALKAFMQPLHFGVAAIMGNQIISWIHIEDLCRMFLHAIENESIQGAYNAVAPQPVTNKVLNITLAKKMRGNFYIALPVPHFMLTLMLGDRSVEILKSTTVSSKKITAAGFTFNYTTINEALEALIKIKDLI